MLFRTMLLKKKKEKHLIKRIHRRESIDIINWYILVYIVFREQLVTWKKDDSLGHDRISY